MTDDNHFLGRAKTNTPEIWSEIDNGQTITLNPGERIQVRLNSNPSTGFAWIYREKPARTVIKISGPDYISPPTGNPPALGSEGWQSWMIKALKPGRTSLILWYCRPWEKVGPSKTYCLKIIVH